VGVSVLIPCYNAEPFLGEAIESVLSQSFPPEEVIVIDDGSTDGSPSVASSFGRRVRLISVTHAGAAGARNAGLLAAQEEFVAWLDADDVWAPHKLEYQLPKMEDARVGLVYSQIQHIMTNTKDDDAWPTDLPHGNIFERLYLQRNFIATSSVVVRRRALIDAGGFDQSVAPAEDVDAWLRVALQWCVAAVPRVLSFYRKHTTQISGDHARMVRSGLRVREKLGSEFERRTRVSTHRRRRLVAKMFLDDISRLVAMRDLAQARAIAIVLQETFASDGTDLQRAIARKRLITSLPRRAFSLLDRLKQWTSGPFRSRRQTS
jgi:glycosyltransferase involved in cell wall biosynthesis